MGLFHGGRIILLWRRPNAPSVALRGGLRLLRLTEFVRYNRAAIGGPSKRQPMNSLVSSCLCSTCYAQTPFAQNQSGHHTIVFSLKFDTYLYKPVILVLK